MAVGLSVRFAVCACALMLVAVQAQDDIRKPPVITVPAKAETRYYFPNTEVTVKCRADGAPAPGYKWLRRGQPIVITTDGYISFNSRTGDLTFKLFTVREEDEYMCIATNFFDSPDNQRHEASSMSPPLILKSVRVDNFEQIPETIRTGSTYSYMKLECKGKGVIQVRSVTINWYDGEQSKQLQLDDRRFIDLEGNLHFAYLLKDDGDIETYTCGVSNGKSNIVLGSQTKLQVDTSGGSSTSIKPLLQYSNTGVQVMLYSNAVLECFFSGYQPTEPHTPVIKWFDDSGNEINPGGSDTKYHLSDDRRKLTIKNVGETDEKNFYCTGENDIGKTEKNAIVLDVISPPIFLKEDGAPKDITRPEKKDATFYCNTRSLNGETAPGTPEWFINTNPTGSHINFNKYRFSTDKKSLTIMKLSKATDIQCVQCKVSNEYGTTWGDACLNVILPITITNKPQLQQEISKGDTIDLTITATTDPSETLSYKWEVNNRTFALKPPFATYDPNSYVAYINTSDLTQDQYETLGGTYRRIITNANDREVVEVEVILKGITPVAVVASGGIDMWIIGLIIGIIFLIIVIIIIIFVICRKKQEGDYNVDKKETGAGLDPEKELKEKGFDDYSRPTYDDYEYPEKKPRGELEYDDVPIGGDDESLAEYGDEADTHFNEDGSFIGIYQNNTNSRQPKSTESTI